ncbi:DUF2167 domain-containing protein [Pontibacter sp. KCTC 32443]|uniref:DUF2167 domain-containing protein n=1 Tax=Pontibacter TaxID=323449 RepID=UPI00164E8BD8|nr:MULTISPECIES: DUF2167 domain-containing protein [Pontibacter]MBC5775827.1 DUF2167 domain-containing protein [Pontibacter sp. KCTC 32443]
MKQFYILLFSLFLGYSSFAQSDSTSLEIEKIEKSLKYQYGEISLGEGMAKLNVPKGFKYLDAEQAEYVLTELWGNPASGTSLGMLVPEGQGVLDDDSWVFDIEYEAMGYVKDTDASEIDYNELLTTMKEDMVEESKERVANGYDGIELIGWASKPYYDNEKKTLHWAKELKFGNAETNTLNYNVRVLGRKGVLMLNAIAAMGSLPEVKQNIPLVVNSVTFEQGHSYFDFDPEVDEVAAWTIGSLVAGKILTKLGFFALILKFWKVIAFALVSGGGALYKWVKGRKREEESVIIEEQEKVLN